MKNNQNGGSLIRRLVMGAVSGVGLTIAVRQVLKLNGLPDDSIALALPSHTLYTLAAVAGAGIATIPPQKIQWAKRRFSTSRKTFQRRIRVVQAFMRVAGQNEKQM